MANDNYVKVKSGVAFKDFLGIITIGTVIIGGYALAVRLFALKGK